jgi:hypothetical protein
MSVFLVDDPELSAYQADLAFPFALGPDSDLVEVVGFPNLMQSLALRGVTGLGECLNAPLDGINFDEFQNGPLDGISQSVLRARLIDQYRTQEDRLTDVDVIVGATDTESVAANITATGIQGNQATTQVTYVAGEAR